MPFIERDFPIEDINELAVREVNARKPIYLIHKWWARRPGPTFRAITLATFLDDSPMKLYYQHINLKDKLGFEPVVFDPFMGGGTTIVEAVRLGAKVVGIDLNPVAWFITKKELEPVSPLVFEDHFKNLEKAVSEQIKHYYKTDCPKGHRADVMYAFWVRTVKCKNCKGEVPLFNSFVIASVGDGYTVFCPKCNYIFRVDDVDSTTKCPNSECEYEFTPSQGFVEGETYGCPHCAFQGNILESVQREGMPPTLSLFAIEYYCETCKGKGYKRAESSDKMLFDEAKKEYEKKREQIIGRLIPNQEIPDGLNTAQVKNFLYRCWSELFNERQLLCLSILLEEILKIEDKSVREHFILTFSNSLNANNMMCKYNLQALKLEPLFGHHVLWPPQWPVENNIWGTKYGRGTFQNYVRMTLKALEYAINPYEVKIDSEGKSKKIRISGDQIKANIANSLAELKNTANVWLLALTSENLKNHLPNEFVDAVITDPPYYQNIMYSEISSFFYVWLQLGLRKTFPTEFGLPSMDNRREIVVNATAGKGQDFYIESMKRCFIECNRVLKKNGFMVMTFHHASPEAWAAILKALVESDFIVKAAYPIHSETRSGVHPGIEYDSIIVCKRVKETPLPSKPLPKAVFEAEVRNRVEADADRIVESHPRLSIEDLYVSVMGRALQVLSENYAVMIKSGQFLSADDVRESLEDLGDIAFDVLLKKFFAKTPEVDRVSKIYAAIFAGKEHISFDTIDKVTKLGGVDFSIFEAENLIGEKKGSVVRIEVPEKRRNWIERKIERGQPLLYIDSAQMFRLAWSEGKFKEAITKYVRNGIDKEKLESYIKFLAERTGDVEWARIAKTLDETPVTSLEKWLP
jgi:adenine-specific DNA methylase